MNLSIPLRALRTSIVPFILIFVGLCCAMAFPASAIDPGAADSARNINYYASLNGFRFSPEPSLLINESEVRAGLLYDVSNQKIVWQKNMNAALPIASLTKMMVALLAVEDVNAGKFTWDDNVRWTRVYVSGGRKNRHTFNSPAVYTLRDVFKAAMIASNNECAEQMARYIGNGDLQATIDRMNRRARELGMMTTYYGNPTGLPAPHLMFDNSASPSDLLMLTIEMLKYNEVLDITKLGYAAINNGRSVIRNHNHLTIDYSGEVDGLKTGYTRRAGFCLVATTAKCEHRLVSIVLGCRGPEIRNTVVRDMFNDYYTSIGLDRLGPNCPNPLNPQPVMFASNVGSDEGGEFTLTKETTRRTHVVRKGENLNRIAAKYNCSPSDLIVWNTKSLRKKSVHAGQKLVVYAQVLKKTYVAKPSNDTEENEDSQVISEVDKSSDTETEATPVAVSKHIVAKPLGKYIYHTVAPGDTLFSIAQRYAGVTVSELKSLNNIRNNRTLKLGMKLKVKVQTS